ncbi:hypothetical protein ACF05T_06615 [Streptomyces lateritius]|uniref:Clp ATPase C-terminal domain-containing protein n=1 Tax=Streptomyces lateritius TaxID=67313 RepID=A0ABW6Y7J9_9ACTN
MEGAAGPHVAAEGFDPVYGARPLRRILRRGIARALLSPRRARQPAFVPPPPPTPRRPSRRSVWWSERLR